MNASPRGLFFSAALLALSRPAGGDTVLYVPGAASADGRNGTRWRTEVTIYNPGGASLPVTLTWLAAGSDASSAPERTVTVASRRAVLLADVVAATFASSGGGALRLRAAASFLAVSRTYNDAAAIPLAAAATGGTFGTAIPVLGPEAGVTKGLLFGLASGGYRTNVSFLSLSSAAQDVAFTLRDASSGGSLGTGSAFVPPGGFTQVVDVFAQVGQAGLVLSSALLEVSAASPVLALATVIDERTGDAVAHVAAADAGVSATNGSPSATILTPGGSVVTQAAMPLPFEGQASDPDGDAIAVRWDFGDGQQSSGLSVTHAFAAPGTYTVTLTATDARGATSSPVARTVTATTPVTGGHGTSGAWGPEVQVSATGGVSTGVVGRGLDVDSKGRLHVVWTEQGGSGFDAFHARSDDGGLSWSPGVNISESPLPASGPNIAVGPDDVLHVAWADRREGGATRVTYARSTDGGASWETPRDLSGASPRDASSISVSVDDRGRVHVAAHWGDPDKDAEPTQVFYVRSTDGGASFPAPRPLSGGSGHAAFPRFSVKGTTGDLVAIPWREKRGNDWNVSLAVSTDGGATFTQRTGVSSAGLDWDPDAAVDRSGAIHLGVMTFRSQPQAVTVDYQRSTDQGRTWSAQRTVSEALARFPFLALDPARSTVWMLWKDERDAGTPSCPTERCADLAARASMDGGLSWGAVELVTDLGGVETKFPSPAVGPDGRLHVVWSDARYGASRETVFARSRSAP